MYEDKVLMTLHVFSDTINVFIEKQSENVFNFPVLPPFYFSSWQLVFI